MCILAWSRGLEQQRQQQGLCQHFLCESWVCGYSRAERLCEPQLLISSYHTHVSF